MSWRHPILLLIGILIASGLRFEADAAPGGLDPSFDYNGIVKTDFGGSAESIHSLALQTNGCIVAGGFVDSQQLLLSGPASNGGWNFALARYLPNGALDPTFGNGGRVVTDMGTEQDVLSNVFVLPGGKILAIGACVSRIGFARYLSNGSLDVSFGVQGKAFVQLDGNPYGVLYQAAIQADGRVLVGVVTGASAYVVRVNADGTLDTSFGVSGKVLFVNYSPYYNATFNAIRAVKVLQDGTILVVGDRKPNQEAQVQNYVVKLLPDGSKDPTFGKAGEISPGCFPFSIDVQIDGKIVILGSIEGSQLYTTDLCVVRINSDGTQDNDFGDLGVALAGFEQTDQYPCKLLIAGDGRIFAVGTSNSNISGSISIACFKSDGALDIGFGSNGKVITRFTSLLNGSATFAYSGFIANNRLVVGGAIYSPYSANGDGYLLARFVLDNSPSSESYFPEIEAEEIKGGGITKRHLQSRIVRRKAAQRSIEMDVTVRNYGTNFDSFFIEGIKGNKWAKVKYYQGEKEITKEVISKKLKTSLMSPEDIFSFSARITPTKKLRSKTKFWFNVSAKSNGDSTVRNVARERVILRPLR